MGDCNKCQKKKPKKKSCSRCDTCRKRTCCCPTKRRKKSKSKSKSKSSSRYFSTTSAMKFYNPQGQFMQVGQPSDGFYASMLTNAVEAIRSQQKLGRGLRPGAPIPASSQTEWGTSIPGTLSSVPLEKVQDLTPLQSEMIALGEKPRTKMDLANARKRELTAHRSADKALLTQQNLQNTALLSTHQSQGIRGSMNPQAPALQQPVEEEAIGFNISDRMDNRMSDLFGAPSVRAESERAMSVRAPDDYMVKQMIPREVSVSDQSFPR